MSKIDNSSKNISAVIVAKNEEKKLPECLKSIDWISEIVLVDNDSVDKTSIIGKRFGAKTYKYKNGSFSERKNYAFDKTTKKWVLFIDADEVVSEKLKEEILKVIEEKESVFKVYAIPRKNIIFGKEFKHGGQWPDYVVRLFMRENFVRWESELHEQPKFKGELGYLNSHFIHNKHDSISEMIDKTNGWSEIEAKLMFKANHPKMNLIRFMSAISREFWLRFVRQTSFLDGTEGIIYGMYQVYSRFISYAKLWEMQLSKKL